VIQVRSVEAGAGVGYGLTHTARQASRLATQGVGYADGWPRRLGGRAAAWFQGVRLPIVGRISMDSMSVDVTALAPGALSEGDLVELIGPDASVEAVAGQAGTIPYELLAGLGRRLPRAYVGAPILTDIPARGSRSSEPG
jgi:alanine racemase